MKNIKKILIAIIIIIVLILVALFSLSYTVNKNIKYKDSITETIKENYKITEEITYSNIYGLYYIFTTPKKVIVLNKEFEKILEEDINSIKKIKDDYELIYKTNKLMYEKTTIKDNKVTYTYYDATNYKKISSTTLE